MKERLTNFKWYLLPKRPLIQTLSRLLRFRKSTITPSPVIEQDYHTDPSQAEYLANIDLIPGELDEDYLNEPERSAIIEFATNLGKDIIHLPAKPKGRVLIGVGLAAMLIGGGAKIIYDHQKNNKTD